MRYSVTELAIAARCARQLTLMREGARIVQGDGGIGQAAHAVLDAFVRRGQLPATSDDEGVVAGVVEALYRELYDRSAALAPQVTSDELVRLARVISQLGAFLGELIVRAKRKGEPFERCLDASERRIALDVPGAIVEGKIDLLCRDFGTGAAYVIDLKTHKPDTAAEEQVRLYALGLRQTGEAFEPALLCASGDSIELRRVSPATVDGVAERIRDLQAVAPRAAADAETCRTCSVQAQCWSRWGRTLEESPRSEPVQDDALRLEKSLRAHRVLLEKVDPAIAIVGPNVVRYKIALRQGESIQRIRRSADDLQRSMGWTVPPLVSNDGTYVAIDAPRREREIVPWTAVPLEQLRGLEIPIGLTLSRELLKLDLAAAPHLLVAGTTNSGKSVFLKALALSLLRSADCKVAIIDPKMLDFPPFNGFALVRPVITDAAEAVAYLDDLVEHELPRRTTVLQKAGATQRTELPAGEMPAIVVIIDEFADLCAMFAKPAERTQFIGSVQRLLQKSRAVGIHLVLATQRPDVSAIPGQLKANLPVRIAFKLPAAHDSVTVLDEGGAENLLGRGDLLLKRDGQVTRAQAFNVSPADVHIART